jgi:hypothetical protein
MSRLHISNCGVELTWQEYAEEIVYRDGDPWNEETTDPDDDCGCNDERGGMSLVARLAPGSIL